MADSFRAGSPRSRARTGFADNIHATVTTGAGHCHDMPELTVPQSQRLKFRANAHQLEPVVLVGAAGLSEAVLKEVDRALRAHGLIKVRVASGERTEREFMYQTIADRLHAARIQAIGHTFVLYRPVPEEDRKIASAPKRPPRKAPAKHAAGRSRSDAAPTHRITDKKR